MFKKIISRLAYIAWLLIAVIFVLALSEMICRFVMPEWAPLWQERSRSWVYHPEFGWFQKKDFHTTVQHPHFDIDVKTNAHGLRDDDYPYQRSSRHRMLVLGDSFVWGYGVEKEERFTEVLESRYPDWEIINAGISGYGTDQEYLYYSNEGYKYDADVVVLLLYYNDFENNYEGEQYGYYKPYFTLDKDLTLVRHHQPVPVSSLVQRASRFIETDTWLLRRLWGSSRALYQSAMGLTGKHSGLAAGFTHVVESMPITNILVKNLAKSVEANGARFVLIAIPSRNIYANNLNIFTAEEKMDYLNLDVAFTGREREFQIPNDDHWNAGGHRHAAAAIEQFLIEKGIFTGQSSSRAVEKSAQTGK